MNVLFCFAAVLFICSVGVVFSSQQGFGFCAQSSMGRGITFQDFRHSEEEDCSQS
jgi:hypothetical protein